MFIQIVMATPEQILQTVRGQGWDRETTIALIQLLMREGTERETAN